MEQNTCWKFGPLLGWIVLTVQLLWRSSVWFGPQNLKKTLKQLIVGPIDLDILSFSPYPNVHVYMNNEQLPKF